MDIESALLGRSESSMSEFQQCLGSCGPPVLVWSLFWVYIERVSKNESQYQRSEEGI